MKTSDYESGFIDRGRCADYQGRGWHFPKLALTLLVLLLLPACSGQSAPPGSAAPQAAVAAKPAPTANPLGNDYKGPPTPCDKELSPGDVTDIFTEPASVNHYSMAASAPGEGCEMGGTGYLAFIDIAIKKVNADLYKSLASFHQSRKPLADVGDEAQDLGIEDSNVPNASENAIIARKGDWVCEASIIYRKGPQAEKALVSTDRDNIARKLGRLCNKLFATHS